MTMRRNWSLINTVYNNHCTIDNCELHSYDFSCWFLCLHLHCLLFSNRVLSPFPRCRYDTVCSRCLFMPSTSGDRILFSVSNSFSRLTLTSKQNVNKQSHHRHQTTTGGWFIDFVALFLALSSFADWRFLFFCFFIVCTHRQVHLISQVADSVDPHLLFFAAFVICGRSIGRQQARFVCVCKAMLERKWVTGGERVDHAHNFSIYIVYIGFNLISHHRWIAVLSAIVVGAKLVAWNEIDFLYTPFGEVSRLP